MGEIVCRFANQNYPSFNFDQLDENCVLVKMGLRLNSTSPLDLEVPKNQILSRTKYEENALKKKKHYPQLEIVHFLIFYGCMWLPYFGHLGPRFFDNHLNFSSNRESWSKEVFPLIGKILKR